MKTTEPTEELEKNIHDNEELEWVVRPDRRARLTTQLSNGIVGAAITSVVIAVFAYTFTDGNILYAALGFVVPFVLVVGHAAVMLYLEKIEFAATDHRLIDYRGRFGRSLDSVPFDGIQDAEYDISFTENLYGVGTVRVDTDRGYETMSFEQVPDPEDFSREIVDLASRADETDEADDAGDRETQAA